MNEHRYAVKLDAAKGGWFARSEACPWEARRPTYYKSRSLAWAQKHIEDAGRWGGLPSGELPR